MKVGYINTTTQYEFSFSDKHRSFVDALIIAQCLNKSLSVLLRNRPKVFPKGF